MKSIKILGFFAKKIECEINITKMAVFRKGLKSEPKADKTWNFLQKKLRMRNKYKKSYVFSQTISV